MSSEVAPSERVLASVAFFRVWGGRPLWWFVFAFLAVFAGGPTHLLCLLCWTCWVCDARLVPWCFLIRATGIDVYIYIDTYINTHVHVFVGVFFF